MIMAIFVSVGTHKQQFDRLLKEIDNLIENGKIKENVFAQTGYSTYKPKNYKYKKFLGLTEFDKKIKECELFITHGGEGNIGTALQHEKKMIVIARRKKYGEHTNDHQIELTDAIAKEKQAIITEVKGISKALKEVRKLKINRTKHAKGIIDLIKKELN